MIFWTLFLFAFVDYGDLFTNYDLRTAIKFDINRVHPVLWAFFLTFVLVWFWQFLKLPFLIVDYREVRHFYHRELNISERDLQTVKWNEIVSKLSRLRYLSPSKEYLSILDIANIILRKENYMIALVNKEILDLRIPLLRVPVVTKALEWGLTYAFFNFVFDSRTFIIKKDFLRSDTSSQLASTLRRRFRVFGFVGLLISPFVLIFLLIYFFFKYGEEIRNKPSILGARDWSTLARWKFRDLNEVPHLFEERLNRAYPLAQQYVDSFHSYTLTLFAKFVLFVVGSVAIVLLLFGLYQEPFLTRTYIIPERWNILLFLGVLGTILAVFRALLPPDHFVADPNLLMEEIALHTHHIPDTWIAAAHTHKVRDEFMRLFAYRIVLFATEVLSVLFTPFVLMISLPRCAEHLIQFVREFTVFEEGLGPVCKFALFDLKQNGSRDYGALNSTAQNEEQQMRHGKLEMSILNFKGTYPEWEVSSDTEEFLEGLHRRFNPLTLSQSGEVRHSVLQHSAIMSRILHDQQQRQRRPVDSAPSALQSVVVLPSENKRSNTNTNVGSAPTSEETPNN
jgi:hypothetical protein